MLSCPTSIEIKKKKQAHLTRKNESLHKINLWKATRVIKVSIFVGNCGDGGGFHIDVLSKWEHRKHTVEEW